MAKTTFNLCLCMPLKNPRNPLGSRILPAKGKWVYRGDGPYRGNGSSIILQLIYRRKLSCQKTEVFFSEGFLTGHQETVCRSLELWCWKQRETNYTKLMHDDKDEWKASQLRRQHIHFLCSNTQFLVLKPKYSLYLS